MNAFKRRFKPPSLKMVLVLCLLPFLWWSLNRNPPFRVKSYVDPSPVKAGGEIIFIMPVHRDLGRGCSVKWHRHIIDFLGVRHDLKEGEAFMSAQALAAMDQAMGSTLKTKVTVPGSIARGKAVLVTNLRYVCNPLQALFPIELTLYFPFEVVE